MSIQIEVPLEALSRAPVAQALSDLMLLLGGHRGATRPSAATPKAPRQQRHRPSKKPAGPPKVEVSADPKERWRQFVITRPDNTRRFLALLEQHGQLNISQAVEYLDLKGPKSMGGLTGALRRWAPVSGVELPFKAIMNAKNERAWVWVGAAAVSKAPTQRRRPIKKPAPPGEIETSTDPKVRWRQLVSTRLERSRRFLALLEQHGQLSISQAVEYLELSGPKSMGGLVGALRRWATASDVELPFQAIKNADDERVWVWVGVK